MSTVAFIGSGQMGGTVSPLLDAPQLAGADQLSVVGPLNGSAQ